MKKSLGLDYLKPLLERGGRTEAAAESFSLGDEYWGMGEESSDREDLQDL
jgi:hypothetical protein